MSKRKQSFDNLLEDYSGASEKALYGPEKAERKRTRKTRRSKARDEQDEVQRNYGRFDQQPTDKWMSSESDADDREDRYRGQTFYSVEELERLQDSSGWAAQSSTHESSSVWELFEFAGASYRRSDGSASDSISFNCKNSKVTKRRSCGGRVVFRLTRGDEGEFIVNTDDLTEYRPHDDRCEYAGTNQRLKELKQEFDHRSNDEQMDTPVDASTSDRQIIVVVGDPFEVPRQTDDRQTDDRQADDNQQALSW